MNTIVEVIDVWKMLGYQWILRRVNVRIPKASATLITGPNGSGKSTLLKIMGGIWRPTRGSVRVGGRDPSSADAKKRIGIVLHENVLYDEMTVMENLRFYSGFYNTVEGKWRDYMEILGIDRVLDRRVKELSFGWKRRANILRALLNSPELLIIDEPLTGLDRDGREAVLEILHEITRCGGTVVAASPTVDREVADRLDAKVFTMMNGRIVEG